MELPPQALHYPASHLYKRDELVTSLETLQIPPFRSSVEASLHRHDRLKHWPWVIEFSLKAHSPPPRLGDGTECSSPLLTWLASLAISPQPEVASHQHDERHLYSSQHLGNSKGLISPAIKKDADQICTYKYIFYCKYYAVVTNGPQISTSLSLIRVKAAVAGTLSAR